MATLKCTLCGSSLVTNEAWDYAFCESCGIKYTNDSVRRMAAEMEHSVLMGKITDIGDLFACAFGYLKNGDWEKADDCFEMILDVYPDNIQAMLGKILIELTGKRVDFNSLGSFIIDQISYYRKTHSIIGKEIPFGRLKHLNNITIIWRILDVQEGKALLISDICIDQMPFDKTCKTNKWADCSLRRWLNREFYKTAFTAKERAMIIPVVLPEYDDCDNLFKRDTEEDSFYAHKPEFDYLFALSVDEALDYFDDDDDRTTIYPDGFSGSWWLRTPGCEDFLAACVYSDGEVSKIGNEIDDCLLGGIGVRPAMWVSLHAVAARLHGEIMKTKQAGKT